MVKITPQVFIAQQKIPPEQNFWFLAHWGEGICPTPNHYLENSEVHRIILY